jgi:hypothetical protein
VIRRIGGALAVAALVIGATQAAATAARWQGADASGDVSAYRYDPEPQPCGTFTDLDGSAETSTDITGLVVNHRKRTVHLVARFRDLHKTPDQTFTFQVRTPTRVWDVVVLRVEGTSSVEVAVMPAPAQPDPSKNDECGYVGTVTSTRLCLHPKAWISPARDTVTVDVPRGCLNKPRWVQAGFTSYRWDDATGVTWTDTWGPAGSEQTWYGPFGPRVRRG